MKTIYNTEINIKNVGETVTLYGWVQKKRDLGGLIFIDLRDRYGITQLVFSNEFAEELNNIRKKAVMPLVELSNEIIGATGKEITQKIYLFMRKNGVFTMKNSVLFFSIKFFCFSKSSLRKVILISF